MYLRLQHKPSRYSPEAMILPSHLCGHSQHVLQRQVGCMPRWRPEAVPGGHAIGPKPAPAALLLSPDECCPQVLHEGRTAQRLQLHLCRVVQVEKVHLQG